MKPTVIAAAVFAVLCVALGAWLLSRPREAAFDPSAPLPPSLESFTFAAWSARDDCVLLVEVEPQGTQLYPKQFHIVDVSPGADGKPTTTDGAFLSWAPDTRALSKGTLLDRGFPMTSDEVRPYPPVSDPLAGDAPGGDAGSEQTVLLRSHGGLTAVLRRRRSTPGASIVWGKRAMAFPSSDGKLAYVIPDKVIVPIGSAPPPAPSN